jgi:hypothetical protein
MTANASRHRIHAILRAAYLTLHQNPRLLWFPVLSSLGTLAALIVAGLITGIGSSIASDPTLELGLFELFTEGPMVPEGSERRAAVTGSLLAWLATQLVSAYVGVALSRASFEALAGRPWNVRDALQHTNDRLAAVAAYAVVNAGVGRLLRAGERVHRIGNLSRSLLRTAWWAVTYLALPVLAREDRGGLASITRSASLFRETWKEAFVGRIAVGIIMLPVTLLVLIPLALCIWLEIGEPWVIMTAVGIPLILLVVSFVLLRTLDTIYRTALYVFATEGVVPGPFEDPDLNEIFCVR